MDLPHSGHRYNLPAALSSRARLASRARSGWPLVWILATSSSWGASLHVGDVVEANTAVNVRTAPAGALAGTRVISDRGRVVGGPVTASLPGGSSLIWWQIDWATGVDGWSFEGGLDQRTLTQGIDVSHWQGDIDWSRVAGEGGRAFAIAKASEGDGIVDAKFTRNMSQGRAAGVLMGAYHFARPSATPSLTADALAEARLYVRTLHPWLDDGGLRPVLDLEDGSTLGKSALSSWTRTFLNEVRRLTTADALVYTSRSFAQNFIETDLSRYPLWIAAPNTTPGTNTFDLGPWSRWALQQYSWTGQVPGIAANVDLNAFSGGAAQLTEISLPPLTHPLADLQASPATAVRGAPIELKATVTSSQPRSLLLGATLFPAGLASGGVSDPVRDKPVALPAGAFIAGRSFVLPNNLPPGDYDLVMALTLDLDGSGTINTGDLAIAGSRRTANALRVAAAPGYATWASAAGLTGAASGPEADPDDDGWSNLLEYAFGLPPTSSQPESPVSLSADPGTGEPGSGILRLHFSRWPDRTDVTYTIQQSDHPETGSWSALATATGGAGFLHPQISESSGTPRVVTVEIPIEPSTPRFLRVQATLQ